MIPACDQRLASGEMTRAMRPMTEPTLDLIVQRAMLSNDVAYEVLPCDPDMADTAAFCAHYGFAIEQAANTILVASKKIAPPKYAACVLLGTTRLDVNKKVSELLAVCRRPRSMTMATSRWVTMQIRAFRAGRLGFRSHGDALVVNVSPSWSR
jgi:hypothetical protein